MKIRPFLLTLLLTGLLAACNSAAPTETAVSNPTATQTAVPIPTATPPPPTMTPSPTPEPATAAEADSANESEPEAPAAEVETVPEPEASQPIIEDVTIAAADGLEIQAAYYGPGGAAPFPGVILLHMLGSNRQVWTDNGFAETLAQNGCVVLAVDMRGHGDTGGDREWVKAEDDLRRVWQWLIDREQVDGARAAVIGASIGSNIALRLAASEPAMQTAVLLSPGLDYRGVTTADALAGYGERPLLIVASQEDSYAANSSRTLSEQAQGETSLQLYDGAGHGTNMFGPQPGLADLILDWLNRNL